MHWPELTELGLCVYLRRDDLISKYYGGNKFYKLYYNLLNAKQLGANTIVSFGGAYSNHLYALAALGKELNFNIIGFVRSYSSSNEPFKNLSPTLEDAKSWGMQLYGLNKIDYQRKDISAFLPILKGKDYFYIIPEGGENLAGVRGCVHLGLSIEQQLQVLSTEQNSHLAEQKLSICCATGTGSTLAGICSSINEDSECLGFSVLKGKDQLSPKVENWLANLGVDKKNWKIISGFHHGGYGRVTKELLKFMAELERLNNCLFDPVYTAKMLFGIYSLAKQGYWQPGSKIVAIHSGGIQGRRGYELEARINNY
jgi:1-aminocyclopropane-1-carboxylate deaminase